MNETLDNLKIETFWPIYALAYIGLIVCFFLFLTKALKSLYNNVLRNFLTLIFSPNQYFKRQTESWAFTIYFIFLPFVISGFVYSYITIPPPYYALFIAIPLQVVYHCHNICILVTENYYAKLYNN